MSIHRISRELVAYRNRLEQLAKDKGQGDVQLAGEEVASLIEELRAETRSYSPLIGNWKASTQSSKIRTTRSPVSTPTCSTWLTTLMLRPCLWIAICA